MNTIDPAKPLTRSTREVSGNDRSTFGALVGRELSTELVADEGMPPNAVTFGPPRLVHSLSVAPCGRSYPTAGGKSVIMSRTILLKTGASGATCPGPSPPEY